MPFNVVAKVAITAFMTASQMALTMTQRIKGPRLDSLKVTTADFGTAIPRFWGMRRFDVPVIWAEELREEKTESKTKGGKYEEYKYYATFAVLICDHEIEAVTRIWMDKHLVYDVTKPGPIAVGMVSNDAGVKLRRGRNMRIYLGTETQLPDPRMETWCEDRYGADSCPAYRQSAYIVFESLPVEKFGNRIPQVTIEAVSVKADNFIYEDVLNADLDWNVPVMSRDAGRLLHGGPANYFIWDLPTRTLIRNGVFPTDGSRVLGSRWAIDGSGTIWITGYTSFAAGPAGHRLYSFDSDGVSGPGVELATSDDLGNHYEFQRVLSVEGSGSEMLFLLPSAISSVTGFAIYSGGDVLVTDTSWIPRTALADYDGGFWVVGQDGSDAYFHNVGGATFSAALGATPTGPWAARHYRDNDVDHFVLFAGAVIYLIDFNTHALNDTEVFSGADPDEVIEQHAFGVTSVFLSNGVSQIYEYSLKDGSLVRTLSASSWVGGLTSNGIYDAVNRAWLSFDPNLSGSTNGLRWYYIDRVAAGDVTLADVVDDVSEWCGLAGQDTSALTQPIAGYSATQGAGKDMIAPLLDIHDIDARPHDFTAQFVVRGSSPSGTLLTDNFVRDGESPRYTASVQQDTDLPALVVVNFADVDKDQQGNTASSKRNALAIDSTRNETIDLTTYVASVDDAQQLSDRRFRRIWNERERSRLGLTSMSLALEPGDVTTASLDGVTRTVRLDKLTIRGSTLDCEFVRDTPSLHTLNGATGAEMEGRDPQVIYVPAQTKGFVIDGPLIADADNDVNPIIYVAAGPYGNGSWPGAAIYRGDDGTYDDTFHAFDSASKATWGYAADVLATANPNLWDRGNAVNIWMGYGALTSATEAGIDLDPSLNLAMLGGEYLQFVIATLEADGSYTLSGLKRGRRGTEWAVGTHVSGEEFVLLSAAVPIEVGTDLIGDALSFKAPSIGRPVDSASPINLTYTGASLKPRAPVIWHVTKDPSSGDISIELRSRTRIGGNWNGAAIPTGEALESYEFDVYDGATFKRTLASASKTLTYPAADQTTDFGSGVAAADLEGTARQISATVGDGFERLAA